MLFYQFQLASRKESPQKDTTSSTSTTNSESLKENRLKDTQNLLSGKKRESQPPGGANSAVHIPKFYFPMGRPLSGAEEQDVITQQLTAAFKTVEEGKVKKEQMGVLAKVRDFFHF